MPNGKTCRQGQYVAGLYGRKASVGRVADISSIDTATVQFLRGNKLNKRDIQEVHSRFLICPVAVQHDIKKEIISIPHTVQQDIKRETDLYIHTYM